MGIMPTIYGNGLSIPMALANGKLRFEGRSFKSIAESYWSLETGFPPF